MQRFYGVEVEDGAPGAWALAPGGVAAGMRQRLVLPGVLAVERAGRVRPSGPRLLCCCSSSSHGLIPTLPCHACLIARPCSYPRATFSRLPRALPHWARGGRSLPPSVSLSLSPRARGAAEVRSGRSCFVVPGAAVLLCCCGQGQSRSAGSERQRRRQALGGGQICRLRHCTAFRCPALP
jgi:hypothetical protein